MTDTVPVIYFDASDRKNEMSSAVSVGWPTLFSGTCAHLLSSDPLNTGCESIDALRSGVSIAPLNNVASARFLILQHTNEGW